MCLRSERFLFRYFSFDIKRNYKFLVNGKEYKGNLKSLNESKAVFTDVIEVKTDKKKNRVEVEREKIEALKNLSKF